MNIKFKSPSTPNDEKSLRDFFVGDIVVITGSKYTIGPIGKIGVVGSGQVVFPQINQYTVSLSDYTARPFRAGEVLTISQE